MLNYPLRSIPFNVLCVNFEYFCNIFFETYYMKCQFLKLNSDQKSLQICF